jgi:hypothetical protein
VPDAEAVTEPEAPAPADEPVAEAVSDEIVADEPAAEATDETV